MPTFRQLRASGRFDEAMARLFRFCQSKNPDRRHNGLRTQIFGERCLILDWASHKIGNGQRAECGTILNDIRKYVLPLTAECRGLVESRLRLIEAMTNHDGAPSKVHEAIEFSVRQVAGTLEFQPHDGVTEALATDLWPTPNQPLNGPAFLKHLKNAQRPAFDYDAIRRVFHDIASDCGWMHPGLLLAGETLAALESGGPVADFRTTNWIMFAAKVGGVSHGVLARLTMERLPGGRGLLVPDPFASGYHQMQESFSTGLQHAWLAARTAAGKDCNYDWRWRIEIEEATRETPFASILSPSMEGPSAEGALTCALLAAGRGEELDRNTCMSARLQVSSTRPWLQSTLELDSIDSLDIKTLADRLRVKKIRDIIVSDLQTDIETDTGSGHNFIKVNDVATAETHFGIWPKITRAVRAGLHKEATELRHEWCGVEPPKSKRRLEGRGYIVKPIGLRRPGQEPGPNGRLPESEPLSSKELKDFSYGRWKPADHPPEKPIRLRLFADSGMGKTVQLLLCEQKISGDRSLRIPIRLGRHASSRRSKTDKSQTEQSLEGVGWRGRRNEDLEQLATLHLEKHIPEKLRHRSRDWIIRQAELGQLAFLLDALDQTRSDLELMATFLKTVPNCPVVVAGRPESIASRSEVFENQEWTTLELLKLDQQRQRSFLGTRLASELIPEKDLEDSDTTPQERRKHQWKDLLRIPLLICLMKKLAIRDAQGHNDLVGISNRYTLYSKAADQLFQKGLRSIPKAKRDQIRDQALKLMKAIAGNMVCNHNFDVAEGDEFDQLRESIDLSPQELQDLVQLDIIKEYAFLERIELEDRHDDTVPMRRGIEWRHRSFLEYYGALHLADLWKKEPEAFRSMLREVHETLDKSGHFRMWPAKATTTKTAHNQFRNLSADWHWTLRFLMSHLAEPHRSELARDLIALSNPWIVFEAIDQDHLEFDSDVAITSRWLVHQNYLYGSRDYTESLNVQNSLSIQTITLWEAVTAFQTSSAQRPQIVADLYDPMLRDAGLLRSLRYVLEIIPTRHAQTVEAKTPKLPNSSTAYYNWKTVTIEHEFALEEFLSPDRWVTEIPGYPSVAMSDFPVTNAVFEAFCASHRRYRSEFSFEEDHPALYVSWHMAQEFCQWLSDRNPGRRFFLPHEHVWEAACRWGTPTEWKYWWGSMRNDRLCWYGASESFGKFPARELKRTRSRDEAITAYESACVWHPSRELSKPGLLDMSGNVWEWCENCYSEDYESPGCPRVCRGGSWYCGPDHAVSCGFDLRKPVYRDNQIAFRLCVE